MAAANLPTRDTQFGNIKFTLSETTHRYGANCHILADPFLLSHLAQLCSKHTTQPIINELITTIYSSLLKDVVNKEFPTKPEAIALLLATKPTTLPPRRPRAVTASRARSRCSSK